MNPIHKNHTIELVNDIKEQLEKVLKYEQKIPLIEVDIVKENIRTLYEIVDSMGTTSAKPVTTDSALVNEIDKEIESLLDRASKEADETKDLIQKQEEVLNEQIEEEEDIQPEVTEEVVEEIISTIENEVVEEVKKTSEPEKIMVEDKKAEIDEKPKPIENGQKIVHVLDVEPEDEDDEDDEDKSLMGDRLKKKAIKSLKQGIGINDKFMIINDLFEGRAKDYNAAIKELDNQKDQQSAIFLLEDMKDENLWESKDRAYIQFRNYIERRYM